MAQSALIAAFLVGLFGGLHCAAMCGGWLSIVALRGPRASAPLVPRRVLAWREGAAHAGRLTTYVLLGAALGASGGTVLAVAVAPPQRGLYVAANVFLLILALELATRAFRAPFLERAGLAVFSRVLPSVRALAARDDGIARFGLGAVWGLTPCALVYGVLPVALLSGDALSGASVMLAFGLGTLPNLLAATFVLRRGRTVLDRSAARVACAAVIGLFALAGLFRALFVPEALGQGPFCIVG